MRIPRLFIDAPLQSGAQLQLPAEAAHYVSKVLRLKPGRPLLVFNGTGGEFQASLVTAERRTATVAIEEFVEVNRESPLHMELAIGISRGERMDWVVQKATELGVTAITPIITERTEVKLDSDRQASRLQRWQQVAISACEQSQRTRVPTISPPKRLEEFLERCDAQHKLVLHPSADASTLGSREPAKEVCVLVGPEGGFSEAEIRSSVSAGFRPWQIGPRILRTETAPVAALSILQAVWGDYSGIQGNAG